MVAEAGRAFVVRFAQEQRAVAIGMLLQEQRVLLEEPDARGQRLALERARLRRVVDAHVGAERNGSVLQRPPRQVRVLAEVRPIELRVEPVDGHEHVPAQHEVGGHEADAFEPRVGHRPVALVVRPIGHDAPLDADDTLVGEVAQSGLEPVRVGAAVVIGEREHPAAGVRGAGVAGVDRTLDVGVDVEQVERERGIGGPRGGALVDDDDFEVLHRLARETLHERGDDVVTLVGRHDDADRRRRSADRGMMPLQQTSERR
ncbi:hypothetical protein D3C83_01540 [compost metagenome]